ncbi:uncharacterized protein CG42266 isoform X2 [Drosophila pseudoobscura]|uniref:Uncharacterized protein CG42266 isoform X2 n=1 Tax=Drosophila pseudoobscura pseudoobscura TaxID=46245 RepID=Q29LS4_DROPS|nr:uncharacterized protein CG42266 isoform X2 [Drosophila pseudoobscura]
MLCDDEAPPEQSVCRCPTCVLRKPVDVPWPEALELEAEEKAKEEQAEEQRLQEERQRTQKRKSNTSKAQHNQPLGQKALSLSQKALSHKALAQRAIPQESQEKRIKMDKREVGTRRTSIRTIESLHSNATMLEADRQSDFRPNSEGISAASSIMDPTGASQTQQQPQQPTILLIVVNKPPENQFYPPPGAGYGPGPARGAPNYYNPPPGPGFGLGRGPPGYGPGPGPPGYGRPPGPPGYGPGPNYGQYPGYGPGPNYGMERRRNDGYRENRPFQQRRGDPRDRRDSFQGDDRYRQPPPPPAQGWRGGPPPRGRRNSESSRRTNEEREGDRGQVSRCRCGQDGGGNDGVSENSRNQSKRCMCVSDNDRYMQSNPPSHRNCHCEDGDREVSRKTYENSNENSNENTNKNSNENTNKNSNENTNRIRDVEKARGKNTESAWVSSKVTSTPPDNPLPFSKETTCSHQKEEVIVPGKKTYRYVTVPVCITHGNAKSCVCCDCHEENDEDDEDNVNRTCDCDPQGHCSCLVSHSETHLHDEVLCECDMTNLERTLEHLIPNTDCTCFFNAPKKRRKRKRLGPTVRYDRFANPPFVLNPRPRCLAYSCNTCCCPVGRSCYNCDYSHACCCPCCW